MTDVAKVAAGLTPMEITVLIDCCDRGSTRTNDGGIVDDILSRLCGNRAEGVTNGWLVMWSHNHPRPASDPYMNRYEPTPLGLAVRAHIKDNEQ